MFFSRLTPTNMTVVARSLVVSATKGAVVKKRSTNAFNYFTREEMKNRPQEFTNPIQYMAIVGKKWKALSDAQKAPWYEEAQAMKAERDLALPPKRPRQARNFFMKEQYVAVGESMGGNPTFKDIFDALSPADLQKYEVMAEKDRVRYDKETEEYKARQ